MREKVKVSAREKEKLREIVAIKRKGGKESEEKRGKMRERETDIISQSPFPQH